jgi:hypothetical protein
VRTEVNLPPAPPPVLGGDGKTKAGGAHCVFQPGNPAPPRDSGRGTLGMRAVSSRPVLRLRCARGGGRAPPRTTRAAFRKGVPTFSGSRGLGRGTRKTRTEWRGSAGALLNISPPPPASPSPSPPRAKRKLKAGRFYAGSADGYACTLQYHLRSGD